MTKDEAETKVCHIMPETLIKLSSGQIVRDGEPYCITNKCMAWQTYEPQEWKNKAEQIFRQSGQRIPNPHGYCSQGAKPEEAK